MSNPVHERDGWRCVLCGHRADSVHHRIHGNRADTRPSNLLSVCGDGTTGDHGRIEANPDEAMANGWTVSKYDPDGGRVDTAKRPAYLPFGLLGPGWYSLDDDYGLNLIFPQPDPPHLF